jgi:hypothetical protein
VLAVRELFPASEASWRVPIVLLFSGSGMAFGGWLAGAIYDYAGFYAIAFATGIPLQFDASGDHRCPGLARSLAYQPGPRLRH